MVNKSPWFKNLDRDHANILFPPLTRLIAKVYLVQYLVNFGTQRNNQYKFWLITIQIRHRGFLSFNATLIHRYCTLHGTSIRWYCKTPCAQKYPTFKTVVNPPEKVKIFYHLTFNLYFIHIDVVYKKYIKRYRYCQSKVFIKSKLYKKNNYIDLLWNKARYKSLFSCSILSLFFT